MTTDYIAKLAAGEDLSFEDAKDLMLAVTAGSVSDARIAGVLMGLRIKGETIDEIAGFASAMRDRCTKIRPRVTGRLTDTCGTGGASLKTVNISTMAALVAAAAGIPVAKHGNRSVTSICGSADVLEALGANLMLSPEQVKTVIEQVGFGFLFAPVFHPSMKYAIGPRKELGIRTIFNVLGPLTNPACAQSQVLGVFSEDLVVKMAGVLRRLGVQKALVVYGRGGLDEISNIGSTVVAEVDGEAPIRQFEIRPEEFGLKLCRPDALNGGPPEESASVVRAALGGVPGCIRDVVLLNSAAAIYVGGAAGSISDGMELARVAIDSGAALKKLDQFVEATRSFQ